MGKKIKIGGQEFELRKINSNSVWPAFFGEHIKDTDDEFEGYVLKPIVKAKRPPKTINHQGHTYILKPLSNKKD